MGFRVDRYWEMLANDLQEKLEADVFSESATKAYASSRFEPSPGQDLSRCRIERSGHKFMLRFRLS